MGQAAIVFQTQKPMDSSSMDNLLSGNASDSEEYISCSKTFAAEDRFTEQALSTVSMPQSPDSYRRKRQARCCCLGEENNKRTDNNNNNMNFEHRHLINNSKQINFKNGTRKWHSESADPAKALGPSYILDRNPVVDIHYLLF